MQFILVRTLRLSPCQSTLRCNIIGTWCIKDKVVFTRKDPYLREWFICDDKDFVYDKNDQTHKECEHGGTTPSHLSHEGEIYRVDSLLK